MKDEEKKRIGIGAGVLVAFVACLVLVSNTSNIIGDEKIIDITPDEIEEEIVWKEIYRGPTTAENDPGFETGGFMSIFWLDYGEVPETVLANNATDWSASADVHAYEDADAQSTDTVSEDPSYIVVRACFTQAQCGSAGTFNGSRCRATLTASGDETISQTVVGNNTAETYGGGIESENTSSEPKIYINFYFDDNSDGYRLLDDGSVTWSLVLEAKY